VAALDTVDVVVAEVKLLRARLPDSLSSIESELKRLTEVVTLTRQTVDNINTSIVEVKTLATIITTGPASLGVGPVFFGMFDEKDGSLARLNRSLAMLVDAIDKIVKPRSGGSESKLISALLDTKHCVSLLVEAIAACSAKVGVALGLAYSAVLNDARDVVRDGTADVAVRAARHLTQLSDEALEWRGKGWSPPAKVADAIGLGRPIAQLTVLHAENRELIKLMQSMLSSDAPAAASCVVR
jgi:hypothetical protein